MARHKYEFWLDDQREGDHEIAALIEQFKMNRQFSAAIRDGLRLIADLKAGSTEVLLELFPLIGQQIGAGSSGGQGGNDDTLKAVRDAIGSLQALPAPPPNYPLMKSVTNGRGVTPALEVKQASVDLDAMGDDFLAFIQ